MAEEIPPDSPRKQTQSEALRKQAAQKKLERFVQAFEESSEAGASLAESMQELSGIIDDDKDGLIAVMVVLIQEIRGLRQDLHTSTQAGGIGSILDALKGIPR